MAGDLDFYRESSQILPVLLVALILSHGRLGRGAKPSMMRRLRIWLGIYVAVLGAGEGGALWVIWHGESGWPAAAAVFAAYAVSVVFAVSWVVTWRPST